VLKNSSQAVLRPEGGGGARKKKKIKHETFRKRHWENPMNDPPRLGRLGGPTDCNLKKAGSRVEKRKIGNQYRHSLKDQKSRRST